MKFVEAGRTVWDVCREVGISESMTVIEITEEFKKMSPNKDNLPCYQESPKGKIQHIAAGAAGAAATGDSLSQYSSGTFGGVLGGSYDIDE